MMDTASLKRLEELPKVPCTVMQGDARELPLRARSVDAVLFSPPYGNAHDYIRSTKLEQLILKLCTSGTLQKQSLRTIGRRRSGLQRFEKPRPTGVRECDNFLESLSRRSVECSRHMRLYFLQMACVLRDVHRVLKHDSTATVVVGDGTSQHLRVPLGFLLTKIAERQGFRLEETPLANRIVSRRFMTKRNRTAGVIEWEWLLRFSA